MARGHGEPALKAVVRKMRIGRPQDGLILSETSRSLWVFPLADHSPTAMGLTSSDCVADIACGPGTLSLRSDLDVGVRLNVKLTPNALK